MPDQQQQQQRQQQQPLQQGGHQQGGRQQVGPVWKTLGVLEIDAFQFRIAEVLQRIMRM